MNIAGPALHAPLYEAVPTPNFEFEVFGGCHTYVGCGSPREGSLCWLFVALIVHMGRFSRCGSPMVPYWALGN
jgi:hypothetical protein